MSSAPRLIGRDDERRRLAELAVAGALVTVTGPGGVGKSRLVADVPADLTAQVAALPPGSGAVAVAGALGFGSVDAAAMALAGRRPVIVIDCCEHVLDGVREVVEAVRSAAPDVTVVATSRTPLGLPSEQLLVLGPLAMSPRGSITEQQSPAVELFLERAAAAGAVLDRLDEVAELCRRLDGLPLAIELAAARSRAIAPGELLRDVDHRLDLLRRRRGRGDRHDSMRAAIEASTATLEDAERQLFECLGVFRGPFDAALAGFVAGLDDRVVALDGLDGLVERSLLLTEPAVGGATYRLLDLLREHAADALAARDGVVAAEERFVDAMVAVADGIVARALERWDPEMLGAASAQYVNLVRACELTLERDERPDRPHRLLLPLFAAVHEGRSLDVWALGQRVLARWPDPPAEVLAVLATAAAIGGRSDDVGPVAAAVIDDPASSPVALALADRAWGLATRDADPVAAAEHFALAREAATRAGYGSMAREVAAFEAGELDIAGDPARALARLADVIADAEAHDDVFVVVLAHLVRSCVHLRAGDGAGAAADLRRAEARSGDVGHTWWEAALLRTAAAVEALGGAGWEASRLRWCQALDVAAAAGALGEVAITLRTAASVAHHLGAADDAAALLAAAPAVTAITVLPALCPPAPAVPSTSTSLVDALDAARRVLGAPHRSAATIPTTPVVTAVGELAVDGDGWRLSFAGRTVRVRGMKGIGDLAVLLARPGVEVHALELMGAHDVGGAAGPAVDGQARREY
ncbi:MAG: hypothetical protein ABW219_08300, partial [Ilumatobacteraceae bacterium]